MPNIKILENFQVEHPSIKEKAVKIVTWTRPLMGWVKLNCDEICCENLGNSGGGGIIHDNNGIVNATYSVNFGNVTNNVVELIAILEGIRLCKHFHFFDVIIESDSCIVVD